MATTENFNYARTNLILVQCGTTLSKRVFLQRIQKLRPGENVEQFLRHNQIKIVTHLKQKYILTLYPNTGKPKIDEWDLSLFCFLLLQVCQLDKKTENAILKMKIMRNKICHVAEPELDGRKFKKYLDEITEIFKQCYVVINDAAFEIELNKRVDDFKNKTITTEEMITLYHRHVCKLESEQDKLYTDIQTILDVGKEGSCKLDAVMKQISNVESRLDSQACQCIKNTVETDSNPRSYWQRRAEKEAMKGREAKNIREQGMDTIFCLDTSDSMTRKEFQAAVDFIRSFTTELQNIDPLDEVHEHVSLVTFGKDTSVQQHLTCDYVEFLQTLDTVKQGGPSQMYGGIHMVKAAFKGAGSVFIKDGYVMPPRVFLITNGKVASVGLNTGPYTSKRDELRVNSETILYEIRELNESHGIRFYPVPIGVSDNKLLEQIAKSSGGNIVSHDDWRMQSKVFKKNLLVGRALLNQDNQSEWYSTPIQPNVPISSEASALTSEKRDKFQLLRDSMPAFSSIRENLRKFKYSMPAFSSIRENLRKFKDTSTRSNVMGEYSEYISTIDDSTLCSAIWPQIIPTLTGACLIQNDHRLQSNAEVQAMTSKSETMESVCQPSSTEDTPYNHLEDTNINGLYSFDDTDGTNDTREKTVKEASGKKYVQWYWQMNDKLEPFPADVNQKIEHDYQKQSMCSTVVKQNEKIYRIIFPQMVNTLTKDKFKITRIEHI